LLGLALGLLVACACRLASRFVDAILRFVRLALVAWLRLVLVLALLDSALIVSSLGLHLDLLSLVLVVALGLVSTCIVDGSDMLSHLVGWCRLVFCLSLGVLGLAP
jgi:hypothetical protein